MGVPSGMIFFSHDITDLIVYKLKFWLNGSDSCRILFMEPNTVESSYLKS